MCLLVGLSAALAIVLARSMALLAVLFVGLARITGFGGEEASLLGSTQSSQLSLPGLVLAGNDRRLDRPHARRRDGAAGFDRARAAAGRPVQGLIFETQNTTSGEAFDGEIVAAEVVAMLVGSTGLIRDGQASRQDGER